MRTRVKYEPPRTEPPERTDADRPSVRRTGELDRLANALACAHFLLLRAVNDGVRLKLARASLPMAEAATMAEQLADAVRLLRQVRVG